MSTVRLGTCADPGPYDWHCTDYPGHPYSHYDAGADTSWNDRDLLDPEHACTDPHCSQGQQ